METGLCRGQLQQKVKVHFRSVPVFSNASIVLDWLTPSCLFPIVLCNVLKCTNFAILLDSHIKMALGGRDVSDPDILIFGGTQRVAVWRNKPLRLPQDSNSHSAHSTWWMSKINSMVLVFNYHILNYPLTLLHRPFQDHKGHFITERQSLGCHILQHDDGCAAWAKKRSKLNGQCPFCFYYIGLSMIDCSL